MLTDNKGVHVSAVDLKMIGNELLESRGVKDGARADDTVRGEARNLERNVGKDVNGVGNYKQNCLFIIFNYLANDGLKNAGVLHDEVCARLPRPLICAGGYNDKSALCQIGIICRTDSHRREKG